MEVKTTPVQRFIPVGEPDWQPISIADINTEIGVSFDLTHVTADSATGKAKDVATILLVDGHRYLKGLLGELYEELSSKWEIVLLPGEVFSHAGREMHLGIDRLSGSGAKEVGSYGYDLDESQVVHEMLHNFTPREDLPMFGEIIYMLEKGHGSRIEEMLNMQRAGEDPKHTSGLVDIAKWLKFETYEEMLQRISEIPLVDVKKAFRKAAKEILEKPL